MVKEVPTMDLPISLKVKNTFIDVRGGFAEDDVEGDDLPLFSDNGERKRQVSEPCPSFARQLSGTSPWRPPDAATRPLSLTTGTLQRNMRLEEAGEEADADDLNDSDREEPETEIEPSWILGRQETEQAWPSAPSVQSQEQLWIPWGLPQGAQSEALLPNMWLCQMPGFTEAQGLQLPEGPSRDAGGLSLTVPPPWPGTSPAMQLGEAAAPAAMAIGAAGSGFAQVGPQIPAGGVPPPTAEWANVTTVMLRNLPNKYTQHMLVEELNQSGFLGSFDFLYLPIDPETNANRGYAFINFVDPSFAWMLKVGYEGRRMCRFNSDKVVSIAPAALQGFEANYAHYSTARVSRGDPAARPLFLRESALANGNVRHEGRRRGGRRSQGSLIDVAARQQQQLHGKGGGSGGGGQRLAGSGASVPGPTGPSPAPGGTATYVGLNGPAAVSHGAVGGKRTADRQDASLVPQFCPFCGGRCQPQFKFCQFCGTALGFTPAA